MVSIASCIAFVFVPDLWQHFFKTVSITLPQKKNNFLSLFIPSLLQPWPLSVYLAQKYLYIYHIPSALLSIPAQQFKLVLDSIVWAFKHTMRNVADIGMNEFYTYMYIVLSYQIIDF